MPDRTLDEMIAAAVQRGVYAGLVQYFGQQPPQLSAEPAKGQQTSKPGAPPRTAYTVAEVAESIGVSKRTVYRLCEIGEIQTFQSGTRVLIPIDALQAYLSKQRSEA